MQKKTEAVWPTLSMDTTKKQSRSSHRSQGPLMKLRGPDLSNHTCHLARIERGCTSFFPLDSNVSMRPITPPGQMSEHAHIRCDDCPALQQGSITRQTAQAILAAINPAFVHPSSRCNRLLHKLQKRRQRPSRTACWPLKVELCILVGQRHSQNVQSVFQHLYGCSPFLLQSCTLSISALVAILPAGPRSAWQG